VPGSAPTTFQATGDQGLGALERAAAKNSPDQFISRAADQNAARVSALQNLAPEHASPDAVGQAFRGHLAALDEQNEARVGVARRAAQQATEGLGGAVPAGADQQTTALQGFGQRLRAGLTDLNSQARAEEGQLWRAIDPNNNLTVNTAPLRSAATAIRSAIPANAAPMEGEVGRIFSTAQLLPAVQSFSEVAALRSRITDAMRGELISNGRSQP
jgi:hypothetical protein